MSTCRRQRVHSRPRTRRRGAVLLAVLICLLVVMLMSAALVRGMLVQQREARAEQRRLQAAWLAESALNRAVAQLDASLGYAGEAWSVSLPQEGVSLETVISIEVTHDDADSGRRVVSVALSWPDDPLYRVREERRHVITLNQSGEAP